MSRAGTSPSPERPCRGGRARGRAARSRRSSSTTLFAVVGRVVARLLGLPYVNVCVHHNLDPARSCAVLGARPARRALAVACLRAVEELRERLGIEDASPFSYLDGAEPVPERLLRARRRYLTAAEPARPSSPSPSTGRCRRSRRSRSRRPGARRRSATSPRGLRVYASFGTVVWRYWGAQALAALAARSRARRRLGRHVRADRPRRCRAGRRRGARARSGRTCRSSAYADQWRVLRDARRLRHAPGPELDPRGDLSASCRWSRTRSSATSRGWPRRAAGARARRAARRHAARARRRGGGARRARAGRRRTRRDGRAAGRGPRGGSSNDRGPGLSDRADRRRW